MTVSTKLSYCLDAAGDLIELDLSDDSPSLIPHAKARVTSAQELAHPLPWTVTVEQAISKVRFLPHKLVKGTVAEFVFEKGVIPVHPYIFVPKGEVSPEESDIEVLIKLYDLLPDGHPDMTAIEEALASAGVVKIPTLDSIWPEIHILSSEPTGEPTTGWISRQRVYRKAAVSTGSANA